MRPSCLSPNHVCGHSRGRQVSSHDPDTVFPKIGNPSALSSSGSGAARRDATMVARRPAAGGRRRPAPRPCELRAARRPGDGEPAGARAATASGEPAQVRRSGSGRAAAKQQGAKRRRPAAVRRRLSATQRLSLSVCHSVFTSKWKRKRSAKSKTRRLI
ncbi:hypothetical protein U9M48_004995 [Paspalum notatum var. saurae]|uniref:Uncharacterized protein n=1 Tax=Paspalum notatum var. saurae TaxID=547442 RepID=A0AAQ3PP55_PASNO